MILTRFYSIVAGTLLHSVTNWTSRLNIIFEISLSPRFMDLSVCFSSSQPKAYRSGLSITCHLSAQACRPVFLIHFLFRLPVTAQNSEGNPLLSGMAFLVATTEIYFVKKRKKVKTIFEKNCANKMAADVKDES